MPASIHKFIIYGFLTIFVVTLNLLLWFKVLPSLLQIILGGIYLLVIPGYLLSKIIGLPPLHLFQRWSIRMGFSIFLIMLTGLLINWLLPLRGINNPLTYQPLIISFSVLHILLLILAFFRSEQKIVLVTGPPNKYEVLVIGLSSLFPLLTIFGAFMLNNGGSNILTMIFLGLAGISIIIVSLMHLKLSTSVLSFYIFMIGIGTLLMLSLRSWYISGYDISREFFLFQLTHLLGFWSMETFRDAYNACLSITLLPTILSHFIPVREEMIFKFLYPVLFAFVPVNMFFIARKFTNEIVALLSALFFISHPWFIDPMVTLARQEMGFLFFSLIILTLFSEEFKFWKRTLLFTLFAASLVVSHYSTTYVAIGILLIGFVGSIVFRGIIILLEKIGLREFFTRHNLSSWVREPLFINGLHVVILITLAFLWLYQITGAASNFGDFFKKTRSSFEKAATADSRSGLVTQVISGRSNINLDTYTAFYQSKVQAYDARHDIFQYPDETYKNYRLVPNNSQSLPIVSRGIFILTNTVYKILLVSIQLFFVSGCILSFLLLRNKFRLDYMILLWSCSIMLASIVLIPYVSQEYNFDRLYLQTMAIMSMFAVLGGMSIIYFLSKNVNIPFFIVPIAMIVLMYWYSFGFIWQFVGGKTVVWLNNFGFYYDITYTHKGEVLAGYWLRESYNKKLIYTNTTGRNILSAYTNIFTFNTDVYPPAIDQNSYVYLTRANVVKRIGYFYLNALQLGYNFPYQFLEDNKNKIYSTGVSEIYK